METLDYIFFKREKVWLIIKGIEVKPIDPPSIQIVIGTYILRAPKVGSISDWMEHDNLALIIINNYLNNNVISHVESKLT